MLPIKKICCPTDFSEPSHEALKVACEMAAHFTSELILVHVVTPIPVIPIHDDPTSFNLPLYEKEMEQSADKALKKMQQEKQLQKISPRPVHPANQPAEGDLVVHPLQGGERLSKGGDIMNQQKNARKKGQGE